MMTYSKSLFGLFRRLRLPLTLPLVLCAAGFSSQISAQVVSTTLDGSADDYEANRTQSEGGLPNLSAGRENEETLRLFADDPSGNGDVMQEGRPIFQFDLSGLPATQFDEPIIESATLTLTLTDFTDSPEFGLELWGRETLLSAAAQESPGEFDSSDYQFAGARGVNFFSDPVTDPLSISFDVTAHLASLYLAYQQTGDPWALFRLQPDEIPDIGSSPATFYDFASAENSDSDLHPNLEVAIIPEPAGAAGLVGVLALGLLFFRSHQRRKG